MGNEAEADGSKFCGLEFGVEVVTLFNSSQIGYSSYARSLGVGPQQRAGAGKLHRHSREQPHSVRVRTREFHGNLGLAS